VKTCQGAAMSWGGTNQYDPPWVTNFYQVATMLPHCAMLRRATNQLRRPSSAVNWQQPTNLGGGGADPGSYSTTHNSKKNLIVHMRPYHRGSPLPIRTAMSTAVGDHAGRLGPHVLPSSSLLPFYCLPSFGLGWGTTREGRVPHVLRFALFKPLALLLLTILWSGLGLYHAAA